MTAPADEKREALALVEDAIVRVPKLGGAGAIYEAELLAVLRAARDALAARSPQPAPSAPEEAVERAARAAYEWRGEDYRWDAADEPTRAYWRERTRAAIAAAGVAVDAGRN